MKPSPLASWLLEEIEQRHMSVREFARYSGIGHSTLNKILNADASSDSYPSVDTLLKLARITRTDLCALMALIAPEDTQVDAETRILVDRFRRLPPELRDIADKYLLGIAFKDSKDRR